jgi:hypothetical protein
LPSATRIFRKKLYLSGRRSNGIATISAHSTTPSRTSIERLLIKSTALFLACAKDYPAPHKRIIERKGPQRMDAVTGPKQMVRAEGRDLPLCVSTLYRISSVGPWSTCLLTYATEVKRPATLETVTVIEPTQPAAQGESIVSSLARSHVSHWNVRCIMCGTTADASSSSRKTSGGKAMMA